MKIKIAGTANDSIVDGPGIRFTIFTQGCPHHCEGCHNPGTHDFDGGRYEETAELIRKIKENPLLDGVTFSGGEPFCQAYPLVEIAKAAKSLGLDIVTYTGYTFEYLVDNADGENGFSELLSVTDILIDGRYIEEQRCLDVPFRGSLNQRILDCQRSLEEGKAVMYDL
jgi:anaerobic ribonucleoside-triphosphate reductase activating protein